MLERLTEINDLNKIKEHFAIWYVQRRIDRTSSSHYCRRGNTVDL